MVQSREERLKKKRECDAKRRARIKAEREEREREAEFKKERQRGYRAKWEAKKKLERQQAAMTTPATPKPIDTGDRSGASTMSTGQKAVGSYRRRLSEQDRKDLIASAQRTHEMHLCTTRGREKAVEAIAKLQADGEAARLDHIQSETQLRNAVLAPYDWAGPSPEQQLQAILEDCASSPSDDPQPSWDADDSLPDLK